MVRRYPDTTPFSSPRPGARVHRLATGVAGWVLMLLALPGCETTGAIGSGFAKAPAGTAETTYDQATTWMETGTRTIVGTVVDVSGKVVGFVVFDSTRTVFYLLGGISSGPFDHEKNPTGFDRVLNSLQWWTDKLFGWTKEGAEIVAGNAVSVVTVGGKMTVMKGGELVGTLGEQFYDVGKKIYTSAPSLDSVSASPSASRSGAAGAGTVTSVAPPPAEARSPSPTPYPAPLAAFPAPSAPRASAGRPAPGRASAVPPPSAFDYNHPGLYRPAQ